MLLPISLALIFIGAGIWRLGSILKRGPKPE